MATAAIVASLVSSCGEKEASEEAPKAREVAVQTQTPKESLKTEKETVTETDLETIVPTPDQITEVPEETTEAIFLELDPGYDIDWEPIPAGQSDEELTLAFLDKINDWQNIGYPEDDLAGYYLPWTETVQRKDTPELRREYAQGWADENEELFVTNLFISEGWWENPNLVEFSEMMNKANTQVIENNTFRIEGAEYYLAPRPQDIELVSASTDGNERILEIRSTISLADAEESNSQLIKATFETIDGVERITDIEIKG